MSMKATDLVKGMGMTGMVGLVAAALLTGCGPQASPETSEDVSETLIVGGTQVAATDAIVKSTVALVTPDGQPFCTGSLISKRVVMTASHCIEGYSEPALYVAFGTVAKNGYFARERLRSATTLTQHESYNTAAMEEEAASSPPNDIALIALSQDAPAAYTPATPLKLTTPLVVGETLTLAGFGLTHWLYGSTGVLRKVDVKLTKLAATAKEIHFGETPGKSACMGDSGGPAFVKRAGKLMLVGVTSRGDGHCSNDGIYTDVRYFSDWIATHSAVAQQ